jgi:hypothetical protein
MITDISETTLKENKTDEECAGFRLFSCETLSCKQYNAFVYSTGIPNVDKTNNSEVFIFKQKIKYPDFKSVKICNNYLPYSLFNRPPPAV